MKWSTFYGEWGKLLYAIAACDGDISQTERKELQRIVSEAVTEFQLKDEFGTPVPTYMMAAYDYAESELIDKEEVMASFLQFVDRHRTVLTDELILKMIDSATHVAQVYYGISKREHQLLDETKQALNKLIQENHLTKTTSS